MKLIIENKYNIGDIVAFTTSTIISYNGMPLYVEYTELHKKIIGINILVKKEEKIYWEYIIDGGYYRTDNTLIKKMEDYVK